jgi:hypothetical protein
MSAPAETAMTEFAVARPMSSWMWSPIGLPVHSLSLRMCLNIASGWHTERVGDGDPVDVDLLGEEP